MSARAARTSEKQDLQTNHAAARKPGADTEAFQFADRRPGTAAQRKLQNAANSYSMGKVQGLFPIAQRKTQQTGHDVLQLRATKIVSAHARTHYNDGWGAQYGIMNDTALKNSVPNSVTGSGSVYLGEFDAPDAEQDVPGQIRSKDCSIAYRDDAYNSNATYIYACGPYGVSQWRDAPEEDSDSDEDAEHAGYVLNPDDFPALT